MYSTPTCNTCGNGSHTYSLPDSMLLFVIGSVEVVLYQAREIFTCGYCYWRTLYIIGCGKVYGTKPMAHVSSIVKVCNFTGACMLGHYLSAVSQVWIGSVRALICPFSLHHYNRLPAPPVLCLSPPGANCGMAPKRPGIHPGGWAQSRLLKLTCQWHLIS